MSGAVVLDTGFRPSRHGFGFANAWHDLLLGVVRSRGRCGGMVFAALDAFSAGAPLPPDSSSTGLPAHDSALARWIWRRQADSVATAVGENLWRFVALTYLPTWASGGAGPVARRELLRVFDLLRSGRPAALGLVAAVGLTTFGRNHQVLAYAAEFGDDRVLIRVYDPNHPRRDDVTIEVVLMERAPAVERIGSRAIVWRGLFVERYLPARVPVSGDPGS